MSQLPQPRRALCLLYLDKR